MLQVVLAHRATPSKAIGAVKLFARIVQGLNPKDLRGLIDDGKKQVGSGIVAVVGVTEDGKAGLAVGVTDDLVKTWSAVDLVKVGAEALGGKGGGGRPDMAQAGGPDGTKAGDALAAIEAHLARLAARTRYVTGHPMAPNWIKFFSRQKACPIFHETAGFERYKREKYPCFGGTTQNAVFHACVLR